MKPMLLCFLCLFIIGCTHQGTQENGVEAGSAHAICVSTDTLGKTVRITDDSTNFSNSLSHTKEGDVHWGHLVDKNEGVVKVYFNKHINQMCREEAKDVVISGTSIFKGKAYISIVSLECSLTYKCEADFYREDKQGKLHKIPKDESIDKTSVALMIEKGKAGEVKVDFPKNCPTGDYLLKIKLHNEQGERYEIYQWFEAYTSRQVSRRKKPLPIGTKCASVVGEPIAEENDDDVFEVVQNMPEFPGGGMPRLMKFLQDNLHYNKDTNGNGIKKRVIIQVIIDKDGSVTHPVILRGANPVLDKEALRVVSLMPKWKPGDQHGVPLKVRFTFPVTFDSPVD